LKLNLDPKIEEFKTCLKQWQHRKLTLLGKVTVIKTYALPKLIYPLTNLQTPKQNTIKLIQDIMHEFLWDKKTAKIKQDTIIQNYEDGGIKMIDIKKFINSLKASWIKKILELKADNSLKHIYYKTLNKYGGNLIFESNLVEIDINNMFHKSSFLKDVLIAWRNITLEDMKLTTPKTVIWNNSLIRAADRPLFYCSWLAKGIKCLEDIFDNRTNKFYTFDFIQFLYGIPKADYLKYLTLINSIPKEIKQALNNSNTNTNLIKSKVDKLFNSSRANKYLYDSQIKSKKTEIKQQQSWEHRLNKRDIEWEPIYKLTFETTEDNKLRDFNYKYLMGIVRTNKELFKFSLVTSTLCDFCGLVPENTRHLFWECQHVQTFWANLSNVFSICNINVDINFLNISLGMPNIKQHKTPINYILMLAKYYIFRCKCLQEKPIFCHFKNYFKYKLNIEKHIAIRKGKIDIYHAKWNPFSILL